MYEAGERILAPPPHQKLSPASYSAHMSGHTNRGGDDSLSTEQYLWCCSRMSISRGALNAMIELVWKQAEHELA